MNTKFTTRQAGTDNNRWSNIEITHGQGKSQIRDGFWFRLSTTSCAQIDYPLIAKQTIAPTQTQRLRRAVDTNYVCKDIYKKTNSNPFLDMRRSLGGINFDAKQAGSRCPQKKNKFHHVDHYSNFLYPELIQVSQNPRTG
jgi:hypothetical protein